ncbi:MAG: hypothetical protein Crog4KO_34840 [Crocinitomicaceae bacterium]
MFLNYTVGSLASFVTSGSGVSLAISIVASTGIGELVAVLVEVAVAVLVAVEVEVDVLVGATVAVIVGKIIGVGTIGVSVSSCAKRSVGKNINKPIIINQINFLRD